MRSNSRAKPHPFWTLVWQSSCDSVETSNAALRPVQGGPAGARCSLPGEACRSLCDLPLPACPSLRLQAACSSCAPTLLPCSFGALSLPSSRSKNMAELLPLQFLLAVLAEFYCRRPCNKNRLSIRFFDFEILGRN